MASRLKYAALVAGACVVAAVLIQAWEPSIYGDGQIEDLRIRVAKSLEMTSAHRLHREYSLGDSLATRLTATTDGIVIEQSEHAFLPADVFRKYVDNQLADVGTRRARLGVFVHDATAGTYKGHGNFLFARDPLYFTGTDSIGPYCFVARPLPILQRGQVRAGPGSERIDLRPCAFWARYGAPGAGVDRWLRQGGYHFASAPARRLAGPDIRKPQLFGSRGFDNVDPHGAACRAGDAPRCIAAVRSPHRVDGPGYAAFAPTSRYQTDVFGEGERAMLSHVEAEFGPDKFARFWTSDAEMEPAFAAAFGVPADTWVMAWARRYYGATTRSPRIPAGSVAITLAFIAVLAASVVLITKYRELA